MYEIAPSSSFAATTPQPSPTGGAGQGYLAGYGVSDALDFPTVWARLLRSGQGIDPQKRRVSGGHVEYEDDRWFGAYGLSLNLAGTGDSLSESVPGGGAAPAVGNLFAALFREIKLWLYREGLLESDGGRASLAPHDEVSSLQRSTLHVSAGQVDERSVRQIAELTGVAVAASCDVACERGVRNLPEAKLALLEAAVLHSRNQLSASAYQMRRDRSSHGPVMGDWLKVSVLVLCLFVLSFDREDRAVSIKPNPSTFSRPLSLIVQTGTALAAGGRRVFVPPAAAPRACQEHPLLLCLGGV